MPVVEGQEDFGSAGLREKPGVGRTEAAHSPSPSCWLSPSGRTQASHSWSEAQSPPELTFCLRTQGPMTRNLFARPLHDFTPRGGHGPAASARPVNWLDRQLLGPTCRPTSGLHCSRFSGAPSHIWRLEAVASGKGIQAGTGSWEGWGYSC